MSKNKKRVAVIACTEKDMRAGGFWPLPRDPHAMHEPTPEEREHLVTMFRAFDALRRLGWREAMHAPRNSNATPFLSIEAGSTGVHECFRDDEDRFWVYDGDVWPARPMLWKPLK